MTDLERDRAEQLYVNVTTSQFQSRVHQLTELAEKRGAAAITKRRLRDAQEALREAQDDARMIFDSVLRGEVEP